MARKNKERVILEDIELKPQVIGYTYQKKSNILRVIIIFIAFGFAVYYINDISVFINDLLGKSTAPSISDNKTDNKKDNNKDENVNEIVYNIYSNELEIKENNLTLNNFNISNNILTFDITNNSNSTIDLSNKKYFIETYNIDKTLLERIKLDIKTITSGNKQSLELDINNSFYYIVLEEKQIDEYPVVNLEYDELGYANITCIKDYETIVYKFNNDELLEIKDTISESDTTKDNYYTRYSSYQNKATTYNNMTGITATFNASLNGYTAVFALDLEKVNLGSINELYYYAYKTLPKVVKFEMQTYGFNCN